MKIKHKKYAAILCMVISALSFSIMQFCVKLTPKIPLIEKVFIRNIFSMIIAFLIIKRKKLSVFGKKENQKYLFGRSLGGFLGVVLFFYGTMMVNLSDAAIINKFAPFVVMILAYFFLKEKITKYHIIALAVAFVGSFLVIKPKFDSSIIPSIILFVSAVLSGIAFTSLRALNNRENAYTIIFHYSFISVILCIPFLFFNFILSDIQSTLILICVGIFAGIGQIALTYAYQFAPASEVSIYDYSNIIFSSLLGYFFLNEIPDWWDVLGGILIILSSIIIYFVNKK